MFLLEAMTQLRERIPVSHPCPNCGRSMQLTRATADTGGISEVRSFGCGECGVWIAESTDD